MGDDGEPKASEHGALDNAPGSPPFSSSRSRGTHMKNRRRNGSREQKRVPSWASRRKAAQRSAFRALYWAVLYWVTLIYMICAFAFDFFWLFCTTFFSFCWDFFKDEFYQLKSMRGGLRLLRLRRRLPKASNYQDWFKISREMDIMEGEIGWKHADRSRFYDYKLLRADIDLMKNLFEDGDIHGLMNCVRQQALRNYGGISHPRLYRRLRVGTKDLIEDYVEELRKHLCYIASVDESMLDQRTKYDFFQSTRRSMGRTALCLSGGGSLAMFHVGLLRFLHEHKCLPRVMSGASGGAIPLAAFAMKRDDELLDILSPSISTRYGKRWFDPFLVQLARLTTKGVLVDNKAFEDTVRAYTGTWTFKEAYMRSGRIINIAVSSKSGSTPPLLNYLTTPDVTLCSALCASCALPNLMDGVRLMAKDKNGKIVPYSHHNIEMIDGSIMNDIPMNALSQLFGVTRFIVCQTNPHLIPVLRSASRGMGRSFSRLDKYFRLRMKHRLQKLVEMDMLPKVLGLNTHTILNQNYAGNAGDILIVPEAEVYHYTKVIAHPCEADMREFIRVGQSSTWPFLSQIYCNMAVEQTLDGFVRQMEKDMNINSDASLYALAAVRRLQETRGHIKKTSRSQGDSSVERLNTF